MGYENSKIYRLVCDDGHYYYGSTIAELKSRYWGHKDSSKTMTSRVYTHIRTIGWDRVQIQLVEAFSCANRTEIRMKENEYIASAKDDPLCLNTLPAFKSDEEKHTRAVAYYEAHKEHILSRNAAYYEAHTGAIKEKSKKRYEENKQTIRSKNIEYIERNKDAIVKQKKESYQQNKEKICKEKRDKRAADPNHAAKTKAYRDKNREKINQQKRDAYKKKQTTENPVDDTEK